MAVPAAFAATAVTTKATDIQNTDSDLQEKMGAPYSRLSQYHAFPNRWRKARIKFHFPGANISAKEGA